MVSIQFSKSAEMVLGQRVPIRGRLLHFWGKLSVMGVHEICDEKMGDCRGDLGASVERFAASIEKRCHPVWRLPYNYHVLTDEDKQWISERLEKVETNLLTEFHKWASPVELRQRSHAAALRAMDAEVESLSDRLKNLEGR
jgi:hypothetical protein